ncbi:hypothetical protein CPC08DRAFT_823721 [Agrocybe pediades]|nr:hypothetical protein CPC08DRAFT_823721 [Agrocybe pediades]
MASVSLYPGDPIINKIFACARPGGAPCSGRMGDLRIYEGKGRHPESRGAICQSCQNCHWTIIHTPPYRYTDAQRLLNRIRYPGHESGNPTDLNPPDTLTPTPSPPRRATQASQPASTQVPELTQDGKVLCPAPGCRTKAGGRKQGSKTCINFMCVGCCRAAALHNDETQRPCPAHSVFKGPVPASAPAPAPAAPASTPLPSVHEPSSAVSEVARPANATQAQVIPPTSQPAIQPASQPSQPSTHPIQPRKSLLQVLDASWTGTSNVKTLKVQAHEIEERKKRTVMLVLYLTNGSPPLRIEEPIPNFPHLRLAALPRLLADLSIDENAWYDIWTGTEWKTCTVSNGRTTVEQGQRVIIKIRPSLAKGLDDCPELDDELTKSTKRSSVQLATATVSPVKSRSTLPSHTMTATSAHPSQPHVKPVPPPSQSLSKPVYSKKTTLPAPTPRPVVNAAITSSAPAVSKVVEQSNPESSKTARVLRAWPSAFYVCELSNGFAQIDQLQNTRTRRRNITVKEAFHIAFPDALKWVKSTYYHHRNDIWEKQSHEILDLYISLGKSPKALYPRLLDGIENPDLLPSPLSSDHEEDVPEPSPGFTTTKRRRSRSDSESSSSRSVSDGPSSKKPRMAAQEDDDANIDPILRAKIPDTAPQPFNSFCDRVAYVQDILDELILDPEESGFYQASRSMFRAGSSGSTASKISESWNVNYYGEAAYEEIVACLENLYPEGLFEHDTHYPMTWTAFIKEFLLLETLVLLISQDRRISSIDATNILRCTEVSSTPIKEEELAHINPPASERIALDLTLDSESEEEVHVKEEPEAGIDGGELFPQEKVIIDLTLDSDSE